MRCSSRIHAHGTFLRKMWADFPELDPSPSTCDCVLVLKQHLSQRLQCVVSVGPQQSPLEGSEPTEGYKDGAFYFPSLCRTPTTAGMNEESCITARERLLFAPGASTLPDRGPESKRCAEATNGLSRGEDSTCSCAPEPLFPSSLAVGDFVQMTLGLPPGHAAPYYYAMQVSNTNEFRYTRPRSCTNLGYRGRRD